MVHLWAVQLQAIIKVRKLFTLLPLLLLVLLKIVVTTDATAYDDWLASRGAEYDHSQSVGTNDGSDGVVVHWSIDGDRLRLAVAANATGWVGVGIAESGGMPGADFVIYSADDDSLTDAYALDYAAPIPDACQNWILEESVVDNENGVIVFETSRELDTSDDQDRPVLDDSDPTTPAHRFVAAWGDDPGDQGYTYHGSSRATSLLRFYSDTSKQSSSIFGEYSYWDFKADDFAVPTDETTYEKFCFTVTGLTNGDVDTHVVGSTFLADKDTLRHVHHIILYAKTDLTKDNCDDANEMLVLWAPGSDDLVLPSDVGFRVGPNGYQTFAMEVHYDNPDNLAGVIDDSGLRLYYTTTLRDNDAGVFQFADPQVALFGQSATGSDPTKYGRWDITCPDSCTTVAGQEVTVFQEIFHMHQTGAAMHNRHYRNGALLKDRRVDYFDFRQAGGFAVVQKPFTVEPGDAFDTTCFFQGTGTDVAFGLASSEEMCIVFMLYYPRTWPGLAVCGVPHQGQSLGDCTGAHTFTAVEESVLGRSFGNAGSVCATVPSPRPSTVPSLSGIPSATSSAKPSANLSAKPSATPSTTIPPSLSSVEDCCRGKHLSLLLAKTLFHTE